MSRSSALAFLGLASLAGCGDAPSPGSTTPATPSPLAAAAPSPSPAQVADWTKRLERIAAGYEGLSRVDDLSRWAPALCRAPMRPVSAPLSAADPKAAAHGQKLYALWTKDVEAYGAISGLRLEESSVEGRERLAKVDGIDGCVQVVVKESFEAVELPAAASAAPLGEGDGARRWRGMRPASHSGKRYGPGAPTGLFVMMRFDAPTPGADEGWVYGTVSPEGVVTGVGRMEACMTCHRAAPHGRLFGLAQAGSAR